MARKKTTRKSSPRTTKKATKPRTKSVRGKEASNPDGFKQNWPGIPVVR
jgi:hypothetical protein